jgi:hypothetical protein
MDLRRLGAGEWLIGVAGIVLLASLFLPWYEGACPSAAAGCAPAELSAWEALAVTDVLLGLLAACALLVVVVTAAQRVPALPLALDGLLALAALVGSILVWVRMLALPAAASGRAWALWLGLAGALGILVGAFLAMRDERLSRPGRPTDAAGVPIPPPPPLSPIAAPPRDGGGHLQSPR